MSSPLLTASSELTLPMALSADSFFVDLTLCSCLGFDYGAGHNICLFTIHRLGN